MSVAQRSITRVQDADDFGSIPGAGNDGYTPVWDNDAGEFVLSAAAAAVAGEPLGVLSSTTGTAVFNNTGVSTISGWAWPVGVRQNFRTVVIPFFATSEVRLPKAASVVIRENNSAGALLGSAYVGLDCSETGKTYAIVADFGAEIANHGAVPLWIGVECDGSAAFYVVAFGTYPVASGYAQVAWSSKSDPLSPSWVAYGTQYLLAVSFFREASAASSVVSDVSGAAIARVVSPLLPIMPGIRISGQMGTPAASFPYFTSGTFSGWGQYIGDVTEPINAISTRVYLFAANPPSQAVVYVRRMPTDTGEWAAGDMHKWEIVATSNVISLDGVAAGTFVRVVFALDRSVSGKLYVEVVANGGMCLDLGTGTASGTYTRYRASSYLHPAFATAVASSDRLFQMAWGTADWSNTSGLPLPSSSSVDLSPVVEIHLPTDAQNAIRCLEGVETNIYWRNIIKATSQDGSLLDASDFLIDVTCGKGAQIEGGWRYTPTSGDAGSTTFTVSCYDQTRTTAYASVTCTLVTVALSHPSTPVARSLVVIGDSTTNNGTVLAELVNLFDGDTQYTLTLLGTNNGAAYDADGDARAVSSESVSGWSFAMFDTDTTTDWTELGGTARTGSVFENAGAFDFAHYLSAESISLTSGDWVFINLGINDLFSYLTDDTASTAMLAMATILSRWITSIKAAVSGIRIGICLVIPTPATEDAFATYENGQTVTRYNRNRGLFIAELLAEYDNAVVTDVYVIPINATLDPVHGWATSSVVVNARSTVTYDKPINGVHPGDSGYWQIADTYRAFLKAVEA